MSDKFVFELVLNVDGSTAKADVKKLVKSLQTELNQKFSINIDLPNSKSTSNRLARLTRRLEAFNHELTTTSRLAPVASHAIGGLASATGAATATFKDLRISSAQANKVLQGNATIINAGATAMERLGAQTALTTRRYAAFLVASRAFFGLQRALEESIGKAIDFNTEIVKISQITDLPVASIAALRSEIRNLATDFGTPAQELAGVANTLAQAGFSISETQKLLKNIAPTTLAPTFGEVNDTVDGLIAVMAQFNIEASKSGEILDTLNELAAQFPAEVGDLFEIVKRAGSTFSAASGVREGTTDAVEAFKELAAIGTAVRSTTRLNASQIGTSLRTIFGRIQGQDVLKDLEKLGIVLTDADKKFVGPIRALEILNEKLKGISTQSAVFTDIATSIGGLRQLDKTIILLSDLEGILEALEVAQSTGVDGSVFRDVNQALGDTGVQLRQLRESFDAFTSAIVSSDAFQAIVKGLIVGAKSLIEAATKLSPIAPLLATVFGGKAIGGIFSFAKGFIDNIRYMNVNTEAINRNTSAILTMNRSLGLNSPAFIPHFGKQKHRNVGFASGGPIRGPGGSTEDNLLTAVSNGEYIVQASAVKKFGVAFLNSINQGRIPGFARGGRRTKLLGGGVTSGKFGEDITNALTDAKNSNLISQARLGAVNFKLNPDAVETVILHQLKKGIDPDTIRKSLLDIFNTMRTFIDSRVEQSKIKIGQNIQNTPSNSIVPAINPNVLLHPTLLQQSSKQLRLPFFPQPRNGNPIFDPIRPDLNTPTTLPRTKPLLNLAELGIDTASSDVINIVIEYNKALLKSGETQESIIRQLKSIISSSASYTEVMRRLNNEITRGTRSAKPSRLKGGGANAGSFSSALLTKTKFERSKRSFQKLPILNPDIPIDNIRLRDAVERSQLALPAPTRPLGLPAPTEQDNRNIKARKRRDFREAINNPPIILGEPLQAVSGPERQNFNFIESDNLSRRRRLQAKFVKSGKSEFEAARLADIQVNRNRAGQRFSSRNVGSFLSNKGPAISGALLSASLAGNLIPTKPGGTGENIQAGLGAILGGAGTGSLFGPVGTALGAFTGLLLAANNAVDRWTDSLVTKEIIDFRKELEKAKTDRQKIATTSKIIGTSTKRIDAANLKNAGLEAATLVNPANPAGLIAQKLLSKDITTTAQGSFAEVQGEIDQFTQSLAQEAFKNGFKTVGDFAADKSPKTLGAIGEINKLARLAGINFDAGAEANKALAKLLREAEKKAVFDFTNLQKVLSDTLTEALNSSLEDLSRSLNVAVNSLNRFGEQTERVTQEGLGNFVSKFSTVDIGAGTVGEIRRAVPGFAGTPLDAILNTRDAARASRTGLLLEASQSNEPGGFLEKALDDTTKNSNIPQTLRNSLKRSLDQARLELDPAASEADKFAAFKGVYDNFINSPVFANAEKAVQDYVTLINRQNSVLQENTSAYLELINAQRESIEEANKIRRGGRDFALPFTSRFEDTKTPIATARKDFAESFKTLFPNINAQDPGRIGTEIEQERNRLRQLEGGPQTEANAQAIRTSNDRLNQLVGALKFLKDSTDELSAIQNRLVDISKDRESTVNFARGLATASPEEQVQINRQLFNLKKFEQGGILTASDTGGVLDFIDKLLTLPEEVLQQFGRSRADLQVLQERIIGERLGKVARGAKPITDAFKNNPGNGKEEQDLLKRAEDINKQRADAARELGELATQRIADINILLTEQIKLFDKNLALIDAQAKNITQVNIVADKLAAIPSVITFKGSVDVNVNLNNAQALTQLDPIVRAMVEKEIEKALAKERQRQEDEVNGQ